MERSDCRAGRSARSVGRVTTNAAGGVSRTAARRAADAVARRAEEFARREKRLLEIVTEFHTAAERAERVRSDAAAKAERLVEEAEKKAAVFDERAAGAVGRMLEFGESRDSVAELTGWTPVQVRDAQRAAEAPHTPGRGA